MHKRSSSSSSSSFPSPSPKRPLRSSTLQPLQPSSSSSSCSFPSPKPQLPSPPSSTSTSTVLTPPSTPSLLPPSPPWLTSTQLPSSSSSSSLAFYVRVQTGLPRSDEEIFTHSYKFTLDQKEEENLLSLPVFVTEPEPDKHLYSKLAVLGSKFYIIGGLERTTVPFGKGVSSADVFYHDAHQPGEGWKIGPSLLRPRLEPYVTVANGKIYVFGGSLLGDNPPSPWGEIFDPVLNQWLPLNPSIEIPLTVRGHALLDKDTFIIYTPHSGQLFHLNVTNGSCGVYNRKPIANFGGGTVLLDGLLYFTNQTVLWAYDLEAKEWCNKWVEGLEQDGVLPPELGCWDPIPSLYDIGGGRIGLVWGQSQNSNGELNVKLTTFGIKKEGRKQDRRLVAHSLRHYNYVIKGTFIWETHLCQSE